MSRSLVTLLALATLSAAAYAQSPDPASQPSYNQQAPAPIVHSYSDQAGPYGAPYGARNRQGQIAETAPVQGVWVRSEPRNAVQTVSTENGGAELRVLSGRVNVNVHHPADHARIVVDMNGGQVYLLKDGLYTFNGDSNTVRVLHGEAEAYVGTQTAGVKPVKIKEFHQLAFTSSTQIRSVDAYPNELTADLLPEHHDGEGFQAYGGYGPYGDGFYGYPYYGYGYGYGYPYGFYPGIGIGFGGYGGFGGFRGGYGGGFRR